MYIRRLITAVYKQYWVCPSSNNGRNTLLLSSYLDNLACTGQLLILFYSNVAWSFSVYEHSEQLPKQLLFAELLKKRPFYGAKKRWRDEVVKDLWAISVEDWYVVCQDHKKWSDLYALAVDEVAQCRQGNTCAANRERNFLCNCGRRFKRPGDLTRHCSFCEVYSLSLAQDSS